MQGPSVRNILNSESKRIRSGGVLDAFSGMPILPQAQANSKTVINFSEEFFRCLALPVVVFDLLMSTGLKQGVLAEVHDSA